MYVGIGEGHWINKVEGDGKYVHLEDGSVWEISPLDRIDTMLWLPVTDITVAEGDDPNYPYRLTNTDDNEAVDAKLIKG